MTDTDTIKSELSKLQQNFLYSSLNKHTLKNIREACTEVIEAHIEDLQEYTLSVESRWTAIPWYKKILHLLGGTSKHLKNVVVVDVTIVPVYQPNQISIDYDERENLPSN